MFRCYAPRDTHGRLRSTVRWQYLLLLHPPGQCRRLERGDFQVLSGEINANEI